MNKVTKMEVPFTQVANCVLNDENLSFKAKGIFAYLYSKPQDWNFNYKRISKDSSDGEDAVLSGLRELENAGYLIRRKLHSGRIQYEIMYDKSPDKEISRQGKSRTGETPAINKKEIKQERDKAIKSSEPTEVGIGSHEKNFNCKEVYNNWINGKNRMFSIIARMYLYKEVYFETNEQLQVAKQRHLKAAKKIVVFSENQIALAFEKMIANKNISEEWTLDTLLRYLVK